jgi:hypothetical protein
VSRGIVYDGCTKVEFFSTLLAVDPDRFKDLPSGDDGMGAIGRDVYRSDSDPCTVDGRFGRYRAISYAQ